jgi:hypothetical protein
MSSCAEAAGRVAWGVATTAGAGGVGGVGDGTSGSRHEHGIGSGCGGAAVAAEDPELQALVEKVRALDARLAEPALSATATHGLKKQLAVARAALKRRAR